MGSSLVSLCSLWRGHWPLVHHNVNVVVPCVVCTVTLVYRAKQVVHNVLKVNRLLTCILCLGPLLTYGFVDVVLLVLTEKLVHTISTFLITSFLSQARLYAIYFFKFLIACPSRFKSVSWNLTPVSINTSFCKSG